MSVKHNVILVEDEKAIRNIMKMVFEVNHFRVYSAKTGSEAMMMITTNCPDVVILDLGLPDMDGLEIIKKVRTWSNVPIIVVSARSDEKEKVQALDLGADDYVTKPFGTAELLARVRTALRHVQVTGADREVWQGVVKVGDLCVDYDQKKVYICEEDVGLTQNEFKIVSLLARYPGKILTYDYLIKNIWGPHMKEDNQILRVNMANIRRKMEKDAANPQYIATEIGIGYRMNAK